MYMVFQSVYLCNWSLSNGILFSFLVKWTFFYVTKNILN